MFPTKTEPHPEWINMYEKYKNKTHDEIITYKELNQCLISGDIRDDKRHVLDKFAKVLLRENKKALENVRNKGYRIIKPSEHVRVSNAKLRRAEKQARKGVDLILNVAYELLDDKEKAMANLQATRLQSIHINLIGARKEGKEMVKFSLPEMPRK